jgi:hypothetical protein
MFTHESGGEMPSPELRVPLTQHELSTGSSPACGNAEEESLKPFFFFFPSMWIAFLEIDGGALAAL